MTYLENRDRSRNVRLSRTFFLFQIVPLIAGSLVYLIWRPQSLLLFDWVRFVGVENNLLAVRGLIVTSFTPPPEWLINSAPTGLWAFSYSFTISIANRDYVYSKNACLAFSFFLVTGIETFQISLIPGVFDPRDLLFNTAGFVSGIFIYSKMGDSHE